MRCLASIKSVREPEYHTDLAGFYGSNQHSELFWRELFWELFWEELFWDTQLSLYNKSCTGVLGHRVSSAFSTAPQVGIHSMWLRTQ